MDSTTLIRSRAKQYRFTLCVYFLTSLVTGTFTMWLGTWASRHSSWEAGVIEFIFTTVGCLMLLLSLLIGFMIVGWFKNYKGALASIGRYERDPNTYSKIYRDVVGPFRWK